MNRVENLRAAFNQVKVLKENGYGEQGDFEGLEMYVMNLLMGME